MGGGNSHQRAVQRAAKAKGQSTNPAGPKTEDPPVSAPEHNKPRAMETPLFLAIISFAFTGLIALLQWNGVVTVPWIGSLFGYLVLVSLSLWAFGRWEVTKVWNQSIRVITFVVVAALLISASAKGVMTQHRREHPKSALVIQAHFTGAFGVSQKPALVDLDINNPEDDAVQNLDLAIMMVSKQFILDMKLMTNIADCQTEPIPGPSSRVVFKGADGISRLGLDTEDIFAELNTHRSVQWRLSPCPRLSGHTHLRLQFETSWDEQDAVHVYGTYELMPSKESKVVKVDVTSSVTK